jgi:hypothetical protein
VLLTVFFTIKSGSSIPRILVTLGPRCDFSSKELSKHVDALAFKGSEEELVNQVRAHKKNRIIIADFPIENLPSLSDKIFWHGSKTGQNG